MVGEMRDRERRLKLACGRSLDRPLVLSNPALLNDANSAVAVRLLGYGGHGLLVASSFKSHKGLLSVVVRKICEKKCRRGFLPNLQMTNYLWAFGFIWTNLKL